MKKLIITSASAANELIISSVETFAVEIEQSLVDRIKSSRDLLAQNDLCEIEFYFDASGYWSALGGFNDLEDDLSVQEVYDALLAEPIKAYRMHLQKIHVTTSHITFSAIPKHSGEGYMVKTCQILISDLDDLAPIAVYED